MKGMNKRGQGMSTNTIILLVLGLIILAALSYGFFVGYGAFQDEVGKTNVDQVAEQCKTSCSLNQKFGYCSTPVELRVQPEKLVLETSCGALSKVPDFMKYGVRDCPGIQCTVPCKDVKVNGFPGEVVDAVEEGYYDITEFASGVEAGKFCAVLKK